MQWADLVMGRSAGDGQSVMVGSDVRIRWWEGRLMDGFQREGGWVVGWVGVGSGLCFLFLFFCFGGCNLSGCGLIFMGCDGLMLVGGGSCGLILVVLFFLYFLVVVAATIFLVVFYFYFL